MIKINFRKTPGQTLGFRKTENGFKTKGKLRTNKIDNFIRSQLFIETIV